MSANNANARPNILRADTIDLQDQDAPTAADHTKSPHSNGIAPHQASQYQHVQEERRSEEQTLAEAWNMAGGEDSTTMDSQPATADAEPNGDASEAADDTDAESDDDMMDRISSSPSIDDGGFPRSPRTLTTPTVLVDRAATPQQRHTYGEAFNQSPASTLDSSPFVETPLHMPLRWPGVSLQRLQTLAAPAAAATVMSDLSPSLSTPDTSPLIATANFGRFYIASERLRPEGRSVLEPEERLGHEDEGFCEEMPDVNTGLRLDISPVPEGPVGANARLAHHTGSVQRDSPRNSFSWRFLKPPAPILEKSPSLTSITSVDMKDVLLPVDDPLLHSDNSSDSWESSSSVSLSDSDPDDGNADAFVDLDDRFVDSGWGGECLQDTEDIDFEFVYALHTFVATVEGQANATKGDTMVLLDDSNSYWWLVRVVKDSSIGYLPAEHIETPTERLARLNKHRNIDLSQTMLGDNPERSKNPLKKAMRRRNAKTVQFAAPTYVEASDYDYSSDEEQGMVDPYATVMQQQQQQTQQHEPSDRGQPAEVEERNAPEEANVHATRRLSGDMSGAPGKGSLDSTSKSSMDSKRSSTEDPQLSPKLVDRSEAAPLKSRKGTPRNTDSFLKDESIETRKISLTPGLLRDDSNSKNSSSESARNASLESLVKTPSPQETAGKKDQPDKKKKEKKQGMLSGLFKSKKKDKRASSKDDISDHVEADKSSFETARASPRGSPMPSDDASPVERQTNPLAADKNVAQQQTSNTKPQKAAPAAIDTSRRTDAVREFPKDEGGAFVAELEGSQGAYEMPSNAEQQQAQPTSTAPPAEGSRKEGPLSPIANLMKPSEPKPKKAKRAKQRVELDDFDSPASDRSPNPFLEQGERRNSDSEDDEDRDRLSESPVEITSPGGTATGTFMHGTENVHIPLPNADSEDEDENAENEKGRGEQASDSDSSSDEGEKPNSADYDALTRDADETPTPLATAPQSPLPPPPPTSAPPPAPRERSSSPESLTRDSAGSDDEHHEIASPHQGDEDTLRDLPAIGGNDEAAREEAFNDGALRAWLDAEEVKDLLRVVYCASAVPHGRDEGEGEEKNKGEDVLGGLWDEPRRGVKGMMGELDGLLGDFLGRRGLVFS